MEQKERAIDKWEFIGAITRGHFCFKNYYIKDDVFLDNISKEGTSLSFEHALTEAIIIADCCFNIVSFKNAATDIVNVTNLLAENLFMEGLQSKKILIQKSRIYVLNLEDSETEISIQIDKETIIENIYLKGAKYKHLYTENRNLAIAAYLSKEGIIVPATPEKKYDWLIQPK